MTARPRRPRFADIASAAGVGTATVERVLNERGNVAEETARRVVLAARKLGYDRALPTPHRAAVRVEVILTRPDSAFFARLNRAFAALGATLDRGLVLYRTFLEENTPVEVARSIEDIAREREALVAVVQDHPRIRAAIRSVRERGIPVVLLVSDVADAGGTVFVGIDNASAGRTAGYLMRRALGGRTGRVLTICHGGGYSVHRQRVVGFSQHFPDEEDHLVFDRCLVTRDAENLAERAVEEALRDAPDLVGIYHAGGGEAGVMRAIRAAGRAGDVVTIGHELSPCTRDALDHGSMLIVIDQQPEEQARRAIETVETLVGLRPGAVDRSPVPFLIVTPENMG